MKKIFDYEDINWSTCKFTGYKVTMDERAKFCSTIVKKYNDCNIVMGKTKICFVSAFDDDVYTVLSYAEYDKKTKLMKFHNYPETEKSEPEWIFASEVATILGIDHVVFEKKVYWQ